MSFEDNTDAHKFPTFVFSFACLADYSKQQFMQTNSHISAETSVFLRCIFEKQLCLWARWQVDSETYFGSE